jgi:membrane-associated phospholipid phosphatase
MVPFPFGRLRSCFRWGRPLVLSLLFVDLALAVFVGLARDVVEKKAFGFDQAILTALFHIASPGLTRFMLFVSDSATPLLLVPILLVLAVLWWRRYRQDWIALTVAVVGAAILNQIVKQIFERARPTLFPHLQNVTGYSFPSGHSQAALAFYSVLAYLIARRVDPKWRLPIYLLAGVWIVLVGLSRNYLEVHYPSDVLAAFAVTLPWALAVIFVHQCYAPPVVGEEKVIKPVPHPGSAETGEAD